MNLERFDLNEYLNGDFMGSDSVLLWESVEKIQDGAPIIGGILDKYEIVLTNGQKFMVDITYLTPKKSKDTIIANTQTNKKNASSSDVVNLYNNYFKDMSSSDYICYISFKDEDERQDTTGNVGLMAKGLFSGIKAALLDSTSSKDNLKAICLKAYGKDPTRVRLFQKLMEKYLKRSFPNIINDYVSDDPYVLIIASK